MSIENVHIVVVVLLCHSLFMVLCQVQQLSSPCNQSESTAVRACVSEVASRAHFSFYPYLAPLPLPSSLCTVMSFLRALGFGRTSGALAARRFLTRAEQHEHLPPQTLSAISGIPEKYLEERTVTIFVPTRNTMQSGIIPLLAPSQV